MKRRTSLRILLCAGLAALALPSLASDAVPFHQALPQPGVQPEGWFGGRIAIEPATAVVSAPGWDFAVSGMPSPDAGLVEVYAATSTGWSHSQTLVAPIAEAGRWFGFGLALSGQRLAIASLYQFDIFERSAPSQPFVHADQFVFTPLPGIRPVAAIALDGDRLAYGFASAGGAGRVHVYQRVAGTWQLQGVLFAEAPDNGDYFGTALAFSGDQLLVGARDENVGSVGLAGAVYVYQLGDNTPVHVQTIESYVPQFAAGFGTSLATDDSGRLLVGARDEQVAMQVEEAGAAYLYERRPSGVWQYEQRFVAPDYKENAHFGSSLALVGDMLVIGAPGHDVVYGPFPFPGAGKAYIFHHGLIGWTLWAVLQLPPADISFDDSFAGDVALTPDWLLVGAPNEESAGTTDAGKALVYVAPIFRDGFDG